MTGPGWHYMRANHGTEIPSHCIWFDCESRPDARVKKETRHILTFGWACYSRRLSSGGWSRGEWVRFTKSVDLYAFIAAHAAPKRKLYVFCHNTSFDLPLTDVFGNMKKQGFDLKGAVIDAPPTILTFADSLHVAEKTRLDLHKGRDRKRKHAARTVLMLDTLNLFRMPLAALGKQVGLDKLAMPARNAPQKEWDRYGKRDTEIIRLATIKWFDFILANDLGGFASTLAGQALRAYRHRFMPSPILIDRHDFATPMARDGYYGGRVECFRLGKIPGPLYGYDVNSMFPAVMAQEEFPCRLVRYTSVANVKTLAKALDKYKVMARVTLDTQDAVYPYRTPERLLFPIGTFDTVLATPELIHALDNGHVAAVQAMATYDAAPLFKPFVDFFYDRRRAAADAGDHTAAFLYKILMNSLYGKFGQRGAIWEPQQQIDDLTAKAWVVIDADTGTEYRHRQLGGLLQVQCGEAEARDSMPAIAAHVTACARMMLWRLMEQAGRKNVYYVDTDSLLVNDAGRRRLRGVLDETALGGLKLEGRYEDAEIWGPKDYRFGDKKKTKGVKRTATWTGAHTVKQERWSSLRGLVRTGSVTSPVTRTITKTLAREYKKGDVGKGGWIQPFRMTGSGGNGG